MVQTVARRLVDAALEKTDHVYADGIGKKPFSARFFERRRDFDTYATFQNRDSSTPYRE